MSGRAPWRYAQTVEPARVEYLADPPAFGEIGRLLCDGFIARDCHIEPADVSQLLIDHGCKRVSLKLAPGRSTSQQARMALDLLFNSIAGLRAQFYISSDAGDAATAELLAILLRGPLTGIANGLDHFTNAEVVRSLCSPAAKVWINEEAIPADHRIDIQAPKWIAAQLGETSYRVPAERLWTLFWGTTAPIPDYLLILGAWLDRRGQVSIDPEKADRSQRLSAFGWV